MVLQLPETFDLTGCLLCRGLPRWQRYSLRGAYKRMRRSEKLFLQKCSGALQSLCWQLRGMQPFNFTVHAALPSCSPQAASTASELAGSSLIR
jgi:hypothetical protein